jgi:hypothetical protein
MLAIFEYIDLGKLVLKKEVQSKTNVNTQAKYGAKNQEAPTLIKLLVRSELFLEVQDGNDACATWGDL